MAVDKKSDHVGNHGGAYTDINGHRKQFTYVDHDVKPTISNYIPDASVHEQVRKDREKLISNIIEIPPVFCPEIFSDFTLRGERHKIEWNETMLKDEGLPYDKLRDVYSLARNKMSLHSQGITP